MSYLLVLSTPAADEYEEAFLYYRSKSLQLAGRFSEDLLEVIERIERSPLHFQAEGDTHRRAQLKRFPFTVFYKVFEAAQMIEVVAIWHQARRPGGWKE
jgi:plasmid stabilization system protein ParE